jgi:RNA polymerase sigma-70 factor, ECF subfamily
MDATETGWWFDEMGAGLVLYARQIAGDGAEDAVQEVFLRLVRLPTRPENLKAWLLLAVRRAALDWAKGIRRRAARERLVPMFEATTETGRSLVAAEAAMALGALPQEEREIVTMRIWNDATLEQIGQVMGIAVSTVHHRYKSGLEKLRARLELPCRKK